MHSYWQHVGIICVFNKNKSLRINYKATVEEISAVVIKVKTCF